MTILPFPACQLTRLRLVYDTFLELDNPAWMWCTFQNLRVVLCTEIAFFSNFLKSKICLIVLVTNAKILQYPQF